jgi:hypothetical protein
VDMTLVFREEKLCTEEETFAEKSFLADCLVINRFHSFISSYPNSHNIPNTDSHGMGVDKTMSLKSSSNPFPS